MPDSLPQRSASVTMWGLPVVADPSMPSDRRAFRVTDPTPCRQCHTAPATVAVRSGLEWHPTCAECAEWWSDDRKGPLSNVAADYEYED